MSARRGDARAGRDAAAGSAAPAGWDAPADLDKAQAEIPDPDSTPVPADLRSEIEAHMALYPDPHSAAIPALQAPGRTSLRPREVRECLALKLWDPASGRMVGYP